MSRFILFETILLVFVLCSACANKAPGSNTSHATVFLRDGTKASGAVTASSPAEISLTEDGGGSRTIPMTQVRSIEYDDTQTAGESAPAKSPSGTPRRAESTSSSSESTHREHYHPPQSAIHTRTYNVPEGTEIPVRLEESIDSSKAVEGQTYAAEVAQDVLDESGDVVIPRGSNAQVVIKSVSKGGRFHGASDLVLDLRSVSVEGQAYTLDTTDVQRRGKDGIGANRRTAEYTGGAAAIGAIIGAIAGGGKGAAIGAGSGAGAGAITQILTKGGSIRVPAETILTFKLDRALRVVASQ